MKKLGTIVRPEELEDLKDILEGCQANGIMTGNIVGYGNQKGYTQVYRDTTYTVNLLPEMKVETVAPEGIAGAVIDKVVKEITTGNYGDDKIFIYDVQDTVRIRTEKKGAETL